MKRILLRSLFCAALVAGLSSGAFAQATRTWVSGVGDDANPCSRTAPCKTFAGAISKTADNGEIDAIDPGGFGVVTITKSITIDGGGTFASILAAGTNGVNVNDAATAAPNTHVVRLRNISINGAGTGFDGIRFLAAKQLFIENCQVFGFRGNGANSDGLEVNLNSGAATFLLSVKDSLIENNTGNGIRQGIVAGNINASYDNVVLAANTDGLNATGGTANISRSVVTGNTGNGLTASGGAIINASNNEVTSNGTGINSTAPSTVRISNNDVYRNGTGLGGVGTYNSFNNNHVIGNTSDGLTPPTTMPR